jgi:hypothetical protein
VDAEGYLYVTGPVGLWIYAPDGTLILSKTIQPGTNSTNCNWGPEEEPTLYITAGNSVYKVTNKVESPDALHSTDREETSGVVLFDPQPNPVTEETQIPFYLDKMRNVTIRILDASGRNLFTLTDHEFTQGAHSITWNTTGLTSGSYFILLESGQKIIVKPCVKAENNQG